MRSKYKKLSRYNSNNFIDILVAEIKADEAFILVEDTVEDEMRGVLEERGMSEISWDKYCTVTGRYKE